MTISRNLLSLVGLLFLAANPSPTQTLKTSEARTASGVLQGVISADDKVRTFKGIPYAAPPVGPLRWKEPQPASSWTGIRKASEYGPRCMQGAIYSDMIFHDGGPSEDCLYLNLWMPAHPAQARLPVMFWIHGGGFAAGSSSEPRQDGGNLSKQGVLVVSLNYRLGIFGFFSLPQLSQESPHRASGNYGLLDQVAALRWVHDNIALFGGDPDNVTIFGESAGSFSVSALMASPLTRGLFQKAIGESGAFFSDTLPASSLPDAEKRDSQFVRSVLKTSSLGELRTKPAGELLKAALSQKDVRFRPNVDGYFLPRDVQAIYAAGEQSHVPLLAGWNLDEGSWNTYFGKIIAPTVESYRARAQAMFGDRAAQFLKLYPGKDAAQSKRSAQDLEGDLFTGFSTWKWMESHLKTGQHTVYRYKFENTLPLSKDASAEMEPRAYHSSEIEFVFSVLKNKDLPWRPEDFKLSQQMSTYWANFARTGNPNGSGLPEWPAYTGRDGYQVLHLSAKPEAKPDSLRARYLFLNEAPLPRQSR